MPRTLILYVGRLLSGLALALLVAAPALADTSSNMDSFYSGALGTASVTGPSAYRGQTANYYTGGSLVFRAPQQSVQLASMQLPSLKAGCGGIDLFTGGFSFVNSAQLAALGKAIVSSAVGFAFNAALQFLSPQIKSVLDGLTKLANDVNHMNINSCQAGAAIAGTIGNVFSSAVSGACAAGDTLSGTTSDYAAGRANCQSGSAAQAFSTNPNAAPVNKNYAFTAIQQIPFLTSSQDFTGLVMNITGTVIFQCQDTGDPDTCTYNYRIPAGQDPTLINTFIDGGTYTGYQCDDFDVCLNPTDGYTYTVAAGSGFKAKIAADLSDMVTKVETRQALTTEEQQLLGSTNLPLLRMIRVMVNAEGDFARSHVLAYEDLIAHTMATEFVRQAIYLVQQGASRDVSQTSDQKKAWNDGILKVESALDGSQQVINSRVAAEEQLIDRIQKIDQALASRAANRFAAASSFTTTYLPR